MIKNKEKSTTESRLPLILTLTSGGEPTGWVTYEDAAYYYSKNKVLWSLGQYNVTLHGGINVKSGKQSILTMDTIIAIDNIHSPSKYKNNSAPALTNKTLFERDGYMCAYCGGIFAAKLLTRDHVIPVSRKGKDTWDNCVTSCKTCNNWKAAQTPEEAEMELRYVPYTPSYHEYLILRNRKILQDQTTYLLKGVSKNSRIRDRFSELEKAV